MRSIKKKVLFSIACGCVCALSLLGLTLGSPAGAAQSKSGKDLYKQNCRVCHEKSSPNGEYSPMTLTQDQWKNVFKNKIVPAHKQVVLPGMNQKLLEML